MRFAISLATFVICSAASALAVRAQESSPTPKEFLRQTERAGTHDVWSWYGLSSVGDSAGQPGVGAADPDRRPLSLEAGPSTGALKDAIALEARRLAQSSPASARRLQAQQPASRDNRAWCLKHSVGCGALIGYGVGFIGGLVHPVRDFSRSGWALVFSGPIGAGIGAVVGFGVS